MGKTISFEKLSEMITLTEQTDGWWLYDDTRGMNLSMREESRDKAFQAVQSGYINGAQATVIYAKVVDDIEAQLQEAHFPRRS